MRLGWGGDYSSQKLQVESARHHFFAAIGKHAYHALEALAKEPIEVFQPLFDVASRFNSFEDCLYDIGGLDGWSTFENADQQYMPLHFKVHKVLKKWGTAYRLEESWIYDCALYTLHTWCAFGMEEPLKFHQFREFEEIPFLEDIFILRLGPADLKLRSLEEEKKRFDRGYEKARDEYFSELAAKVGRHWPKAAKPEELELHLTWLIQYRVNQLSVPTLAERHYRSKTTIYDAFRNLHDVLGLTPVQRTPGRPKNG